MQVFSQVEPLRVFIAAHRAGRRVALVPTMGALHAGHGACVAQARALEDGLVVASVFVNPAQFGAGEDLSAYPRAPQHDLAQLEAWGCDVAFLPDVAVMYPEPQTVWVEPGPLAEPLCGGFRPGHFRGVATVVAKLFNLVLPDVAVFGQKDAQQALVIRAMVRQLADPVELRLARTVRESDGLALSSRNRYLSAPDRERATALYAALHAARERVEAGERDARVLEGVAREVLQRRQSDRIDYVEARRADDLSALERLDAGVILAIAAWIGSTRLIDNMVFEIGARAVVSDAPLFQAG
jgi:pantoate--beta-alanine ligase